jgi:DNA-binding FadR family transcriptional regulator
MEINLKEKEFEEYDKNDLKFHLSIAKYSKNKILFKMMQVVRDLLYTQMIKTGIALGAHERSIKRHNIILDALKERDLNTAISAMKQHVEDSIIYISEKMSSKRKEQETNINIKKEINN